MDLTSWRSTKRERNGMGFWLREKRGREILILKNLGQHDQTYQKREGAKFWEGKFGIQGNYKI